MTVPTAILNEFARRRRTQRLWDRGPRCLHELFAELAHEPNLEAEIDAKLERYSNIDINALRALGANRFAPAPLHEVRR